MSKKRSPHLGARTLKPEDIPSVGKTRTQSVLFSLPILMLLVGLYYHFSNQRAQQNGSPIVSEAQTVTGSYQGTSSYGKEEKTLYFLEMLAGDSTKNIRLEQDEVEQFQTMGSGDLITIEAAPKVSGSNSLWLLSIKNQR